MLLPLLLVLASVALGIAVGLGVGTRAIRPTAIIAAVVAFLAVVGQLLPEAMHELGAVALLVAALAFCVPLVVELGARRLPGRGRLGIEIAYAGLLVHQFADGVALGSLGLVDHDHGHEVSYAAIAAHTVALAALFVLLYRQRSGRGHALARGVGMAVAVGIGAAGVGLLPHATLESAHPWIVAVAAGVLLHVVAHPFLDMLGAHRHLGESQPLREAPPESATSVRESAGSEAAETRAASQVR